jgi:hypothetical protein
MLEMVKTKAARHAVDPRSVHEFLTSLFEEDVHAQRVFSLATSVVGVMHAAAASIHAIGIGLASATGRETKHAIKQVDRLLSSPTASRAGRSVGSVARPTRSTRTRSLRISSSGTSRRPRRTRPGSPT